MENQNSLPSIKTLFVDSWHKMVSKLANLVVLGIISFVAGIIALLIFGGIGLFIAFSSGLFNLFGKINTTNSLELLAKVNNTTWFSFGILLAGFIIVAMILGYFSALAPIIIIDQEENKLDLSFLIKKIFSLIIPLFIVGLITVFFAWGSFFFFFIPVFFVSYFLMFSQYEVILGGKKGMAALKSSVQIVSQYFGEIFVRCLIYFFTYLVILVLIPSLITRIDKQAGTILSMFLIVVRWLAGLYGVVFSLTLYRQVKTVTDVNKKTSIVWIVIVSFLGWLIFGVIAYFGVAAGISAWKGGLWKKYLNQASSENKSQTQTKIYSYIPSNCGLSVPLPETSDMLTKNYRHWIYEERFLAKETFNNLAPVITSIEPVLGGFLAYKKEDQRYKQEDKTFVNSYTGLNIYCTNNTQDWDFDKFVETAKKNDKYKVTKNDGLITWGRVKLYSVYVEGINEQGNYVKDLLNLGVTADKKRIFFIRLWGVADNDPNGRQLNSDLDSILNNLKYREITEAVKDPNQKPVGPTCKQYTIREGEFTSDKCYSQKDYDDLTYYLSRFNSAAFTYNSAISSMRITCNGSEFFKNSCERDKQRKSQAETDMANYRGIINGIIGRGR